MTRASALGDDMGGSQDERIRGIPKSTDPPTSSPPGSQPMRTPYAALLLLLWSAATVDAQPRALVARSPDGQTEIDVSVGDQVLYVVRHRGRPLLGPSPVSM